MGISKEFVLAGRSTFTIELPSANPLNKPHLTYKVTHKEAEGNWKETWFVKLMVGPDNETSYVYLGILNPVTGQVKTTFKSCRKEDSFEVRLLNRILARVWENDHTSYEAHGFHTHHEGKCGCCGRKLTTPESVERGIGPDCWASMCGELVAF